MRAAFADETDDNIYSRFSNPNVQEFVDKMCVLEGAEAGFATASGMSAVFASFMALIKDKAITCCLAIQFLAVRTRSSPNTCPSLALIIRYVDAH